MRNHAATTNFTATDETAIFDAAWGRIIDARFTVTDSAEGDWTDTDERGSDTTTDPQPWVVALINDTRTGQWLVAVSDPADDEIQWHATRGAAAATYAEMVEAQTAH